MKININPLEFLGGKMDVAVATTQNLTDNALSQIQKTATQVAHKVQETPSAVASATALATQEAFKVAQNIRFENLPPDLQLKFAQVGVRNGMRNIQEAAKVFESIPAQVRAQGVDAVREFRRGKDWSHIKAHANGGGSEAQNGIFEQFQVNRARGGRNMTPQELAAAKKVLADAAFKAAVTEVVGAVIKGAIVAAAIELIFSILENSLLFVEGKITQDEMIQRVTVATIKAGIAGAVITGLLTVICMIFPPIAVLLGTVALPLTLVGIGGMGIRGWEIFCHADKLFGISSQTQKMLDMTESWVSNNIGDKNPAQTETLF